MKLQKISSAIVVAGLILPVLVAGQVTGPVRTNFGIENVLFILRTLVRWIFSVFLIVAVIFLLIAAFKYLTSGGDSTKVAEASKMVIYSAVAIAVAILSASIEFIVRDLLNVGI